MGTEGGLRDEGLKLDELEDPGERFKLNEVIGSGLYATVYGATDSANGDMKVAVKVQRALEENMQGIEEEYRILRDLSSHPNLPDFYGAFRRSSKDEDLIYFVMEYCEGGPVTDLVRGLLDQNKKMSETHIAFILREVVKVLVFLHENHVIHRDIKGSNILLTKNGEVKLIDFGLSRELSSTLGRRKTNLGTPCWMAPELITKGASYDNRIDVWALGMTAIELGDGKNPFQDMHPTRVLFQIVRNPPATLYRPSNWSQNYNDFIAECLVKNPEHRPFMSELVEHPFFTELPENDFHLNSELKIVLSSVSGTDVAKRPRESKITGGLLKKDQRSKPEKMQVEDLAALENISEDAILQDLEKRYKKGKYYTFAGDVLLFLNPNTELDIYGFSYQTKYRFKGRSDNEPHIFSVADSAYQDMLHHEQPQNIVISGESMAGKTTQLRHLVKHLIFLGSTGSIKAGGKVGDKINKALALIHAVGNAATPLNADSTRHILNLQLTFSKSGKTSGAIFWFYQLEKWRVTAKKSPLQSNFHMFYYMYDGLAADKQLDKYHLSGERKYRYLRRDLDPSERDPKAPNGPRETPQENVKTYKKLREYLVDLDFDEEQIHTLWRLLAAVLLVGEVEFLTKDEGHAELKDHSITDKIADLLGVDAKKLAWAMCNSCVIEKNTAARKRHSRPEALEARSNFARTLYSRAVDWLVNTINSKLSLSRAVFGDSNCVNVLDSFGFECYNTNGIEQLFANTFNEQIQYYYNQKIFISEMEDLQEEEVPLQKLQFYDNKLTLDEIMNKPSGVMHLLDEANKIGQDAEYLLEMLNQKDQACRVKTTHDYEFSVAHYTGKVNYDSSNMVAKNREFLPPELTEVMRKSEQADIKSIFTNKLSKTGNVTATDAVVAKASAPPGAGKKRWGAALVAEPNRTRRHNTASRGEFSQTKGVRTGASIYRATSLEVLRGLTTGGAFFVRCLRADLGQGQFQPAVVKQQIRALSIVDTARARQIGFSYRVPFDEFLRRYKFLAFDFDETVDETKDNCRLLLVRLKMEGYFMGKGKIFLKYYNEEYLSRLYETQVKKIVKVQCMMRAFLARRNVATKKRLSVSHSLTASFDQPLSKDNAATIIQKHMKGYTIRKRYGPLLNPKSGKLDPDTARFIAYWARRWKRKSMFQVLLNYRAARLQDLVYFSQQVHLFNQNVIAGLEEVKDTPSLSSVKNIVDPVEYIGEPSRTVWKLPFNMKEVPYTDSSNLCGTYKANYIRQFLREETSWDDPFTNLDKGCQTGVGSGDSFKRKKTPYSNFIDTPYCRDADNVEQAYQSQNFVELNPDYKARVIKQKKNNSNQMTAMGYGYGYRSPSPSQDYARNMKQSKKGPAPRPPVINPRNDNDEDNNNFTIDFRKNLRETGKLKVDHIAEMEMKAKQVYRDTENNEEPPFNFQAMLRKTNYKRESLRRSFDDDNNPMEERCPSRTGFRSPGKLDGEPGPLPNIDQKKKKKKAKDPLFRKDSLENIKMMVAAAKDFGGGLGEASCTRSGPPSFDVPGSSDEITAELAPGLILVGKVADL